MIQDIPKTYSWLPSLPGVPHSAVQSLWYAWILFLLLTTPLMAFGADMHVWVESILAIWDGRMLPNTYAYLPIYAQTLAALGYPLAWVMDGHRHDWAVIVVKWALVIPYAYLPRILGKLAPKTASVNHIIITLNPVTIFYLYFGANHILMFVLVALGLIAIKNRSHVLAGILFGMSIYKYLTAGALLAVIMSYFLMREPRNLFRFLAGVALSLAVSGYYFLEHADYFYRIVSNFGAIGAHSQSLEPFHVFHVLRGSEFNHWYINAFGWVKITALSWFLIGFLACSQRLSLLQVMGFLVGSVALFSPEPFRLEPALGLLWLDALQRNSTLTITAAWITVFAHAFSWLPLALPVMLGPTSLYALVASVFESKGLILGTALVGLFVTSFMSAFRAPPTNAGPMEPAAN